MYSACIARLIAKYSELKIQAIITAQIDAKDCLGWTNKLKDEKYFNKIPSVHPIYNRLIEEPDFIVGELYYSSIKSLIISFSSMLEFYLKDSIKLNMMRNYSLLKKALYDTKQVINPIDIVEINDIELLRLKYISEISDHICSGELWKTKLKKYINLLTLPKHLIENETNNLIDAIWKVRNDIAHANTQGVILNYGKNTYKYNSKITVEEYTQFALLFIDLIDKVIAFLSEIDMLALEKWEATDATLLTSDKYKNHYFE